MNDLISRQAAIEAIENAFDRETILNRFVRKIAISAVRLLPSAQPEPKSIEERIAALPSAQPPTDEWCHDCKEYDQERNCCPRFNRVIRTALKDAKPQRMSGRWIRHKDWVSEGYCEYSCSECDMGVDVMYNYCPRCGADMRGTE